MGEGLVSLGDCQRASEVMMDGMPAEAYARCACIRRSLKICSALKSPATLRYPSALGVCGAGSGRGVVGPLTIAA